MNTSDKLNEKEVTPLESAPENDKILHEFHMSRSRRYNSKQSKATRSFLFYSLGIIVVMLVIGFVGFQLLINYSLLLDKIRGEEKVNDDSRSEAIFISPPSFDIPYSATTSSSLTFSGKAEDDSEVELYLNDKKIDTTDATEGGFKFSKIKLLDGENEIKLRASKDKEKSSFSETVSVFYRENEPKLEINNPNNGDNFSGGQSILKVRGTTETYAKVTINGAWAIMDDEGNFTYNYQMQNGENTLNIVAKDDADNKVEREVRFNYSP